MVTGIVIPADESEVVYQSEFNDLRGYQQAVGGHIEAIDLDQPPVTLFANDEAKLLQLPVNRRATLLWWLTTPLFRHQDVICGNTVLVGQPNAEGETQNLAQDVRRLLLDRAVYRVEVQTGSDSWNGNQLRFEDYFEAAAWGLSLADRWTLVTGVRVVGA
ncbi:DUF3846 domain-containing protein [Rhodococcus opacus]|uniref:DUF3846 domain-containing protein n=1 Tax=Rhodococcus opacus TaxID=37919 RepID=UPI001FF4B135|nr:DUF3846 domain-containing protein [Rhodococcus opacus]UOT06780.1 DUF3846 domain-containing protein [Rhodococcus opacus]